MSGTLSHVVVLMMENRSFDHMLGWLYNPDNPPPFQAPADGQSFDGVSAGMANPAPPDYGVRSLSASRIGGRLYDLPPDNLVGHQFPDVRTQIYGDPVQSDPCMCGFIMSRHHQFPSKQPPTLDQLHMVMQGFSPSGAAAGPNPLDPFSASRVLSTLAANFAVCDNWFSSVPGPTFPNRAFTSAATSNGWTDNSDWFTHSKKPGPTIFEALQAQCGAGSAKIYFGTDKDHALNFPCLTSLINPSIDANSIPIHTIEQFRADAARGALPMYAFIEPQVISYDSDVENLPNDQHPPRDIRFGENLMNTIYEAVRTGPGWEQTLLIITYDEHGGFFDHCIPPAATPPTSTPPVPCGFDFRSLGVRVPAVLVSPWIPAGTVFHPTDAPVDHTSVIRTICAQWNLAPLTDRDANAASLAPVLGNTLRPRSEMPDIPYWTIPADAKSTNLPLNDLQRDYVALIAHSRGVACPPMRTEDDARRFLATLNFSE